MRKFTIIVFLVLALFTIASCSHKSQENGIQDADKLLSKSYSIIDITDNIPLSNIENISYLGDTNNYLITGRDEGNDDIELIVANADFNDFQSIDQRTDATSTIEKNCITSTRDGNIICIFKNTEIPGSEASEGQDVALKAENHCLQTTYSIGVFDKNGILVSNNEIKNTGKMKTDDNEELYFGDIISLGDKIVVNVKDMETDKFFVINTNGDILDEIYLGENSRLFNTSNDIDWNVAVSTSDNSGEKIKFIDSSSQRILNNDVDFKESKIEMGTQTITRGVGEYVIFFSTDQCLYGLKCDTKVEEIINWSDSNLNGQYIKNILALPNEEFVVLEDNWSSDENVHLYRLNRSDISELSDLKIIMLATEYVDNELIEAVNNFNKTHSNYQIKIKDYQKYYNDDYKENSPQNQLKMDIVTGEQFDILMLDSEGELLYQLEEKGMFADLSDLMGKEGTISKDDIMPNVLNACENDGKIFRISPTFTVETLAVKKKFVDKENWTVDEMIDTYSALDKKMDLLNYGVSKIDVFMTLFINYDNMFVDYKEHKCNFNSSEFTKLLEFVNSLELENRINWENADASEYDKLYEDMETACSNEKTLLQLIQLSDARTYTRTRYGIFGDDITLIGFPTTVGNGAKLILGKTFVIAEKSTNKDVCWEFVNQFF